MCGGNKWLGNFTGVVGFDRDSARLGDIAQLDGICPPGVFDNDRAGGAPSAEAGVVNHFPVGEDDLGGEVGTG